MASLLLGELTSSPRRLELHITSSEVSPEENSRRTVSIVAGQAAKSDYDFQVQVSVRQPIDSKAN